VHVESAPANCTSLVSTPDPSAIFHARGVEATDLMSVVVLLEEEAFARSHVVALNLTVSNSLIVVVGAISAVYWVRIADVVAAAVSQGNLTVGRAIVHPVAVVVAVVIVHKGGHLKFRYE